MSNDDCLDVCPSSSTASGAGITGRICLQDSCALGFKVVSETGACEPDVPLWVGSGTVLVLILFFFMYFLIRKRALILLTEATAFRNEEVIEVALKRAIRVHVSQSNPKRREAERVLKMLYGKYSEYDALLAFLDLGYQDGAMKLVRGSWLADPNNIHRLLRQQELVFDSFWHTFA